MLLNFNSPVQPLRILGLAALLLLTAPGAVSSPSNPLAPGWHDDLTLEVGDQIRHFRYFMPSRLLSDRPPLVVFFHGGSQSMRETMPPSSQGSAAWPFVAEAEGFILLVPNGMSVDDDPAGDDQRWNDCRSDAVQSSQADDVAFFEALLDWSDSNLQHDPGAVFVTGNSNGAMMTFRLALERPELITAGAAFIGNMVVNSECVEREQPVPMMMVMGTEDTWSPYSGGQLIFNNGLVKSADETVSYWVTLNGVEQDPVSEVLLQLEPDEPSQVERHRYPDANGIDLVRYYRMIGAGHTMPTLSRPISPAGELVVGRQNRDMEGAAAAWRFFRQFYSTSAELQHAVSGLWFDPSRAGEGFSITAGGVGTSLIYYGGAADGARLWLISELLTERLELGKEYSLPMYRIEGGSFGQPPPLPDNQQTWGQASLRLQDCNRARIELDGLDGEFLLAEAVTLLPIDSRSC